MTGLKKVATIIVSVFLAYAVSLILFMIYALVLEYTNVSESSIPIITNVIEMVSVFIGSSLAVIKIKEKGLINGALVGFIYILLLYLLSSFLGSGFGLNSYSISMIIFNIIIGIVGGIIGVNMCKERG